MDTWPSRWDLIIIPCAATKREVPSVAWQLYRGPYFGACLKTALWLEADVYRILSGRYGLVPLEQVLEPYEQRIDRPGAVSHDTLVAQIVTQGLDRAVRVLALCPGAYRDAIRRLWPNAVCPLVGGIGLQMQQLREIRRHAARL